MNDLNLYSPLVREVKDFVCEGRFFEGFSAHGKNNFIIERDFEKAKEYAFEQIISDANLCWGDIKELEMSKINSKKYSFLNYKELSDQLRNLTDPFFKILKRKLPFTYQAIVEEVATDLSCILKSRAINGLTNNLFEKMFQVYKDGGWPCGWKGDYPKGQMIVFSPS